MDDNEIIKIMKEREKYVPFFIMLTIVLPILSILPFFIFIHSGVFLKIENELFLTVIPMAGIIGIATIDVIILMHFSSKIHKCPKCDKYVTSGRSAYWNKHCPNCGIQIKK